MDRILVAFIFCTQLTSGILSGADPLGRRSATKPDESQQLDVLAEFNVERAGDVLLLPVKIKDQQVNFVLDTGATCVVLDTLFALEIGAVNPSRERYPDNFPPMVQMPEGIIEDSDIRLTGDATYMDLSSARSSTGYNIQGIIGASFLNNHIIRIDSNRGIVWFLRSYRSRTESQFPISKDDFGRPTIEVKGMQNEVMPFLIDTGMIGPGIGEVKQDLFSKLVDQNRIRVFENTVRVSTVAGQIKHERGQLDIFQIGPFRHSKLSIRAGTMNAIGLDYLSRYIVTIDLPGSALYLEKGKDFDRPSPFDMSGLTVASIDDVVYIDNVKPNGPAF